VASRSVTAVESLTIVRLVHVLPFGRTDWVEAEKNESPVPEEDEHSLSLRRDAH
jgi:hypothetical protein